MKYKISPISDLIKIIDNLEKEYSEVKEFTIYVNTPNSKRTNSSIERTFFFDFFSLVKKIIINEKNNELKEKDFSSFFNLKEYQKIIDNSKPIIIKFHCPKECEEINGICSKFLFCPNYNSEYKKPIIAFQISQNILKIDYLNFKKTKVYSKTFLPSKEFHLFLSYFNYWAIS